MNTEKKMPEARELTRGEIKKMKAAGFDPYQGEGIKEKLGECLDWIQENIFALGDDAPGGRATLLATKSFTMTFNPEELEKNSPPPGDG